MKPDPPTDPVAARSEATIYREVFASVPVAIALLDGGARIVDVNPEAAVMLGRTRADLIGRAVSVLASSPQHVRLDLLARKVCDTGDPVAVEHRYRRADGRVGWARTSIRRLARSAGDVRAVCVTEDTTSGREALEEHRREAEIDPLTGLLNRRGGDRRLGAALERMAALGPLAVLVCDADGFKAVNDRYGHAGGDRVLVELARRLRAAVRNSDDVARMGGDEFIVVARVADPAEAEAIAARCVAVVGLPLDPGSGPSRVTISAGVAVADRPSVRPAGLLAAADRALYEAKRSGGDGWRMAAGVPA